MNGRSRVVIKSKTNSNELIATLAERSWFLICSDRALVCEHVYFFSYIPVGLQPLHIYGRFILGGFHDDIHMRTAWPHPRSTMYCRLDYRSALLQCSCFINS